ncbi:MAG: capsule assembly Wzi family protein [Candidatus Korobacteraceae bacterium]
MSLNRTPIGKSLLRCAITLISSFLLLTALSVSAMAHAGSVYVPVDSWVYPATERLAALTGASTEVMGMRPWTRAQFARLLERAREREQKGEAAKLQEALEREFTPELNSDVERMALESTYVRSTQIGGTPLRDSYHFGQTIVNDFGRPYGQGFNAISGASGYVQERAGLIYVRGEYQHGASLRSPSPATIAELAAIDRELSSTTELSQGGPEVNNPRLLDTYVGVSFSHFTGTLGKQSLWWGPATGGAMHYSNNIEPIWMARLTNDVPYKIPILGKVRLDMFYGKLQGHTYEPQVWIHGEKISLQPFKSVEFGFTRTVVFLGVNYPFSFNRLWKSYFSVGDNNYTAQPQNNPGDRQGGVDFSWKLPKIPVTLYSDGYCDDDPSPLAAPTRSAFHPGLYIAQFPGALAKLDLRVEGAYTASENPSLPNYFNYWKGDYRDGYTNKGLLIGDAVVGRAGVSWQAWSSYWISPRSKVQVGYLNHYLSPQYMKGGGTQNSFRTSSNILLKRTLEVELGVQSERIVLPLLTGSRAPQYDMSGWFGVKYNPEHKSQN